MAQLDISDVCRALGIDIGRFKYGHREGTQMRETVQIVQQITIRLDKGETYADLGLRRFELIGLGYREAKHADDWFVYSKVISGTGGAHE